MKKIICILIIKHLLFIVYPINAIGDVSDDAYLRIKNRGGRLYNEMLEISIEKDTTKKSTVFVSIKNMYSDTIFVPSKYFVNTRGGAGAGFRRGHINVYACKDSVPILVGDILYYAEYKDCFCFRKHFMQYHLEPPVFEIIEGESFVKIPPKTTIRFSFWHPFIRGAYSFLRIQGGIFVKFGQGRPFVINTNVVYYEDLD